MPKAAGKAPADNSQYQTPLRHTFLLHCPMVCEGMSRGDPQAAALQASVTETFQGGL